MADTIDISSGGAISVDPDALRAVGERLGRVGGMLADAADAVDRASRVMSLAPTVAQRVRTGDLAASGRRIEAIASETSRDGEGTRLMADALEYADLQARQRMLEAADPQAAAALQPRLDELAASDPRVADMAATLAAGWEQRAFRGLGDQWDDAGLLSGTALLLSMLGLRGLKEASDGPLSGVVEVIRRLGAQQSVIRPGDRLRDASVPVTVTQAGSSRPAGPPSTMRAAVNRIPTGDAQVRIDRYTLADGSRRFMIYLDGTRQLVGQGDAWDMASNTDMYLERTEGASYEATVQALEASGAEPGDQIDIVAYSQGGMIGSFLAAGGDYDVRTVLTVGSPVEPVLGPDTQLVQLRNTDDLVGTGLTGGGFGGTSGSPDSFTVTREDGGVAGDPITPHLRDAYLETADLADRSGDPRVQALFENWRPLGDAVEIESFAYQAERGG